jgi:hypothetical protein
MGKVKRPIYTRNRYQILKQNKKEKRSNDRKWQKYFAHASAPISLVNRKEIIQNNIFLFLGFVVLCFFDYSNKKPN